MTANSNRQFFLFQVTQSCFEPGFRALLRPGRSHMGPLCLWEKSRGCLWLISSRQVSSSGRFLRLGRRKGEAGSEWPAASARPELIRARGNLQMWGKPSRGWRPGKTEARKERVKDSVRPEANRAGISSQDQTLWSQTPSGRGKALTFTTGTEIGEKNCVSLSISARFLQS